MFFTVKGILVFVLTIFSHFVFSQTNWLDYFNDTNFTHNPTWLGDTGSFIINTASRLQLDAEPISSSKYLITQSTASLNATWEFLVELDFNPSSSNYALIHLMSSNQPLQMNNQGYFIRIGGTSEDRVTLFRNDGNSTTVLTQSEPGFIDLNSVSVRIKVERTIDHDWNLLADSTGGQNFKMIGSAIDSSHMISAFFGIECHYTSTRSNKFFFDDFVANGQAYIDNKAPKLLSTLFQSAHQIAFEFNEPLDSARSIKQSNFKLNQGGIAINDIHWNSMEPNRIILTIQDQLENYDLVNLFIEGIEDRFGNEMNDSTFALTYFKPNYRDVVINEIMYDPEPAVQLPEIEYLEITNNSSQILELKGWKLVLDQDTFQVPTSKLEANQYRLITSTTNQGVYDTLNPIGIDLGNSWLKNSGETIQLLDEADQVIDAVTYHPDWHSNISKGSGGWSLEQINPNKECSSRINWSSSVSAIGGTPGRNNNQPQPLSNSANQVQHLSWVNSSEIDIAFSYGFNPEFIPKIEASSPIDSILYNPLIPEKVTVLFTNTITSLTQLYITETAGCFGIIVPDTISFSRPSAIDSSGIIINELLFNADEENSEYIELWNTSERTFYLSDLLIARFKNGVPDESIPLTDNPILFLPKTYLLITEEPEVVCQHYRCGEEKTIFEISGLPPLPNDEGELGLLTRSLEKIEVFHFQEDWHHPSISNPQNVSLERIHPNLDAANPSAWHSASSASGYGTPGRQNSQFRETATGTQQIWLENKTISPNNDGLNDLLIIHYNLPIGAVINAKIFSVSGNHIQTLASNELASSTGIITWNGTSDNGYKLGTGIYIILVEWFTSGGEKGVTKLTFALQK